MAEKERTIEVQADHDLDDSLLFGPLAASRMGGSSALMALSGALPDHETVRLRNPASLDLDIITDTDSIACLTERAAISAWSLGASSDTDISELDLEGFPDPDAVRRGWRAAHRSGAGTFWLVIQLAGDLDPPVAIPSGHIFEQRSVNGVQTLAATASYSVVVHAGQPATLVVPAWCLNQHLDPPSGQQLRPTMLRTRYRADTPQDDVWDDRNRVLSS
jgi:hypothetical protein